MEKMKHNTFAKTCQACVRKRELTDLAALAGSSYSLNGPLFEPDDVVVEGRVSVSKLRAGLVMHAAETAEVHDLTMEFVIQPCLNIFLILDGGIKGSFDGQPFAFSALKDDGHVRPTAVAISLAKPVKLTRLSRRGQRTRKVNIQIQPEWLKGCGLDEKDAAMGVCCFMRKHLAQTVWQPSDRAVALAEQALNPPDLPPLVKELYLESRAVELAAEALQTLNGELNCPALDSISTREVTHARMVREFIEHNLQQPLTLDSISAA